MSTVPPQQPSKGRSPVIAPRYGREPWTSLVVYRLLKYSAVVPLMRGYLQTYVYGRENVPQRGRVVIVSNHASDFDPPLLATAISRPVAFMAKEELFAVPVLGQAIRWYGAYPVRRGTSDRRAMSSAIHYLETGWASGIFLDGTRRSDGRVHDPKLGAALIAAKTGAPLLPASLWGTERIVHQGKVLPQRVPVTIRIGQPIPPPCSSRREELELVTQECAAMINAMHALGR
jgi:1-acyl-sn-glycerol-3-phosphate acyltransferase